MKKDIKVAAIQTNVPMSKDDGELQVSRLVKEALKEPVDMVGLPEDCLASYEEIRSGYDPLKFLSNIAKENQIYLFGATGVLEKDGIHNRGFLFNREGKLILHHDKISLTAIEEGLVAGKTLEIADTEFGRMAILVCKDAFNRYSAWVFDQLMKAKVGVVLVPSFSLNVTGRSVELWVDALKALAKWFDMYVVAPGTIGTNSSQFPCFGHALIICPNRVVLAEGSSDKEEILRATLDVKSQEEIRNSYGSKWQPKEVPDAKVVEYGK